MKQTILVSIIIGILVISEPWIYAQNIKNRKADVQSGCSVPTPGMLKIRGQLTDDQEIRYLSPVRYVVIYNEMGPTEDRRIDVLMNVGNINEKDLKTVFCWIGERYPSPVALTINVHTNLATIETPDERELLRDGDDSRFSKFFGMHKNAQYHRYESGREAFGYTISLSPYREREVTVRNAR